MPQPSAKSAPNRFHPDNTLPKDGWVFVFGSNLGGRHGKGAAKVAHINFGAEYGVGQGRTGNAYAIPTKAKNLDTLPLDSIKTSVAEFISYAQAHQNELFFVTRIGCVLAGYEDHEIAPLFAKAPMNCSFPEPWAPHFNAAEKVTEPTAKPARKKTLAEAI